jgi:hypothetical protein
MNSFLHRMENPRYPILILFVLVMGAMIGGFAIIQHNADERVHQICQSHDSLALAMRAIVEASRPVPEQFGELTDDPEVLAAFERATLANEFFRTRAIRILDETHCPVIP